MRAVLSRTSMDLMQVQLRDGTEQNGKRWEAVYLPAPARVAARSLSGETICMSAEFLTALAPARREMFAAGTSRLILRRQPGCAFPTPRLCRASCSNRD